MLQGVTPGGQVIPARPAGGLRVGSDDGDAGLYEVVPVFDSFRVALANKEHHGGGVGGAVVRESLLPIQGQELAFPGNCIDVVGQRQCDHVRFQAGDDSLRLSG